MIDIRHDLVKRAALTVPEFKGKPQAPAATEMYRQPRYAGHTTAVQRRDGRGDAVVGEFALLDLPVRHKRKGKAISTPCTSRRTLNLHGENAGCVTS
jgi:hypothetical protein